MVVRLSTLPTSEQVRRYSVQSDYRSKADAKVAVICHAAEQSVVEFVRYRGGTPPDGYVSPYTLRAYNPEASRKRKQSGPVEDAQHARPAKKKKKGKRRAEAASHDEIGHLTQVGQHLSVHPNGDQVHGISDRGDMSLSQSVLGDGLYDSSQSGVGDGNGSGAARPVVYGDGSSYNTPMYAPPYSAVLHPRFALGTGLSGRGYGGQPYSDGSHPPRAVDAPPESGPSRTGIGTSLRALRRPVEDAELEPGEVVSSAESEFSVSSSRNEDSDRGMNITLAAFGNSPKTLAEIGLDMNKGRESVDVVNIAGRNNDKGKAREMSPVNTCTTLSRDSPSTTTGTTVTATVSHVKNLMGT